MNSDQIYDRLKMIGMTASRNDKKELLHPSMKQTLLYAYNPYLKFYMKKIPKIHNYGAGYLQDSNFNTLDKLSTRFYSGNNAKAAISFAISSLTWRSANLYKMIILKDLRCGINVKLINDVFPNLIPTFGVMLPKIYHHRYVNFPCFASLKVDGLRAYRKGGAFYSRTGRIFSGLDHIKMNDNYEYDGELTIPHLGFDDASGRLRSKIPTPTAEFNVFDLPSINKPFYRRYSLMQGLHGIPYVNVIEHEMVNSEDELLDIYTKVIALGGEGIVVKDANHLYVKKRSSLWLKMKKVNTVDLVVRSIFEGEGKYEGLLGGVVCDNNGVDVSVGSGFDDIQRQVFFDMPEKIVKKTVEVLFHEETKDGSLRHPRFVRIRIDK